MVNSSPSHYSYSLRLFPDFVRVLFGRPASLSRAGMILIQGASPAPRIVGAANIPATTPFVLAFNHYDRPGLGAWWAAAEMVRVIAAWRAPDLPRELHLAMAREWWYPSGLGRWLKQPLTAWFFGQLEKTYGTICLPPILGNDQFRGEGMIAIRRALALTRRDPPELIGIAPEGKTGANLALGAPPLGAGLFLLLLTHNTIPILPVGIYEDAGALTLQFGKPVQLSVSSKLARAERDRQAAQHVMCAIGKQLPENMWGVYADAIREDVAK